MYIPQTKTARQGRGSYFFSIVIPLNSRIAECQVPKPRCLSPVANSLNSRIAECQVPKPRCLSPAANSLDSRIAGRQEHNLTDITGVTSVRLCPCSNSIA